MHFIDEQHVSGFQVGQQGRQVAGAFQHRAGGLPQVHPQLIGDDMRQGRFSKTGRPENQHVVQRLGSLSCGADEDFHLLVHDRLPPVIRQRTRPQGVFRRRVLCGTAC